MAQDTHSQFKNSQENILVFGAGPAGLACALEVSRHGGHVRVIERENRVGGLCRTVCRNGNYFDIGGHRFFSKVEEINQLWRDILKEDALTVQRSSQIFFRKKYYHYPLNLLNVLSNMGLWQSFLCLISYLRALIFKNGEESTFEGWVTNRFGKRLYQIFFKTYTEKVWGIPCAQLSADWAVQRIRGMSLKRAVVDALFKNQSKKVKSFLKTFLYPTYGPGLFCDKLKKATEKLGAVYDLDSDLVSLVHQNQKIERAVIKTNSGEINNCFADVYVSSIPITVLIQKLTPEPPVEVMAAASRLRFRSFMVVNIVLNQKDIFNDNWIYIHSPEVRMGRIQNYKNWSHYMVKDLSTTTLGLEYFVTEGDALWNLSSEQMIDFSMNELETLGIARRNHLIDAFVIRVPKVYPVYDGGYKENLEIIKHYLNGFQNLQIVGRCGMFRYDNSDHALLSGLYAGRNIYGACHNLWEINVEDEYHEEFGAYNKAVVS